MITEIVLTDWRVMGTLPYQPDFSKSLQQGEMGPGVTDWFPASVPGCIYEDLWKAGYIADPYYGENSLACEWVANRWWVYRTCFTVSQEDMEDTLRLRFAGIDYAAQIYLNGCPLGRHEGMYIPFEVTVNPFLKAGEENILVCVLEHAPFADPQPGYTSKTRYLKARFNYKWDFAARLVSLGLYDKVTLTRYNAAQVKSRFIRPVRTGEGWRLDVDVELEAFSDCEAEVSCELFSPDGVSLCRSREGIALHKGFCAYHTAFAVAEPDLWWPNGYGEQNLYELRFAISENSGVSDSFSQRTGFRTLEYRHADGREDALAYNVVINGKRIYLKGTNMVPLDCMTGTVTEKALEEKLTAVRDAHVNFLRIWGGGHIESEAYYDCCDRLGLLILQEFPMSSSGCDDVPSRDPEFLRLLHQAAVRAFSDKRNHPCLVFWDGGNELTDARYLGREDHEGHPATFEDGTLAMLRGLCESICPDVQMLPSSGSGPNALLNVETPGKNHDVHGPWGYMGVEGHYALYNASDSIIHGEFGCGGMTNYDALCRFTPEADRHLATSKENRVWAHHSGGWDTYAFRERLLFGELRELPLSDYVTVSQYIQAEALRYALEANRRRQWKSAGEMTWQFNEPWPNMQCSNVVDYYGGKKLGWYALRDAYAPVLVSLRYDKLFYRPGETFSASLYLLSDLPDGDYSISWEIAGEGSVLASGRFSGRAVEDESRMLGGLSAPVPEGESFSVRLSCVFSGRERLAWEKEYFFLIPSRTEKIVLTDEQEKRLRQGKFRSLADGLDAPRAAVEPVLRYAARWRESVGI